MRLFGLSGARRAKRGRRSADPAFIPSRAGARFRFRIRVGVLFPERSLAGRNTAARMSRPALPGRTWREKTGAAQEEFATTYRIDTNGWVIDLSLCGENRYNQGKEGALCCEWRLRSS